MKSQSTVTKKQIYCKLILLILLLFLFLYGCRYSGTAQPDPKDQNIPTAGLDPAVTSDDVQSPDASTPMGDVVNAGNLETQEVFQWINPEGDTLESRINPPKDYLRIPSEATEITGFLRALPLNEDGSSVLRYDGTPISNQENHAAVFALDVGDRDLQQCADSIIRIYAEYYWSQGYFDKIAFHLTNGFYMEYTKWRDGNRIRVDGNDVRWVKTDSYDDSYDNFRSYLDMVFAYAGTLSLSAECEAASVEELRPGDLFLEGGSPGHCVLVVDIAADETGNLCYLLAQGYMPAQEFHLLKNPLHPEDPWYYQSELTFPLRTPGWTFEEGSLKRWADFTLEQFRASVNPIFPANIAVGEEDLPAMSGHALLGEATDSKQVTLLASGDNLIHIEVVQSGEKADGTYHYDHLYDEIRSVISKADIAVVNQETILGGDSYPYSGYPSFNSPTEIGDALVTAGFDVVLHATNHTLDMGSDAVIRTLEFWDTYPDITVLGINRTENKRSEIPVIEKNGIKIAMLNYTYGLNGYRLPKDKPYLVNLLDKEAMKKDIERAKELADFVIVFPHWGSEYVYEATKSQRELRDFYYELGVDLVIGAHPHVLEPVEWVGTETDHPMLVYYSLGNFLSYQKEAPRMLGGLAQVTITKDDSGTYISDAGITPIVTHFEHGPADYSYGIYPISEYTTAMAEKHGVSDIARQGAFTFEETWSLARHVLGEWLK